MTSEECENAGMVKIPGDHSGAYYYPDQVPCFSKLPQTSSTDFYFLPNNEKEED